MRAYNLSFITDENLFYHVKETVEKWRLENNLEAFNKNLIDPIKLTFDSKLYGISMEDAIDNEARRQIDKSNNNLIGYLQQNIFKYIHNKDSKKINWSVPKKGFDIINEVDKIYVEMKNKHNTMNSGSSSTVYSKMEKKIIEDSKSQCYLVEIIAKDSQNIPWERITGRGKNKKITSNERIRQISIDKFYEIVTGEKEAFKQLVEALPKVVDDVLKEIPQNGIQNNVVKEYKNKHGNIENLESLYLLSFKKYEGFDNLNMQNIL